MSSIAKAPASGKRPFRMRTGISVLSDLADGLGALGMYAQGAKTIYYCDNNIGSDGNTGTGGWNNAFKTLAVAMAASHADVAADGYGWAARNVIFYRADSETVDHTKFAQKTDIVGVGSCDHHKFPRIIGNQAPVTVNYMGCRFINVGFKSPAGGGIIVDIPTAMSGIEFLNCYFDARSSTAATTGIRVTASEDFKVRGCEFVGAFSTAAISVGAGASAGLRIEDNQIESAAVGILVNSSATCASHIGVIKRNTIYATTLAIDENADKFIVSENQMFSAAATLATSVDTNVALSGNNYLANASLNQIYPTLDTST